MGIHFDDRFISNLKMQKSGHQKWLDINNLNTFLFNKYNQNYYGIYLESWSFSDKQTTILASRKSNHAVGLKSIYKLNKVTSIEPYAGYQRSENKPFVDWGWDVGLDAKLKELYIGDYRTNLLMTSDFDLFPQRENISNHFEIQVNKKFSSYAQDSLRVNYIRFKQQYYNSSDSAHFGDIVDIDLESKNLYNVLKYSFSSRTFLQLNTILVDKRVSDNTPANPNIRDLFRIENRLGLRIVSPRILFYLGLHTFQETLDNIDVVTDSDAKQTGIRADISYIFENHDHVDFQFDFIKYQYDSPDPTIHDDRDELRFIGSLRYLRQLSPLLSMDIGGDIYLSHKMYLHKEQSANNKWDRTYTIKSSVYYRYKKWRNTLRTAVLAYYVSYDFDHFFVNTRSFVFRKYSISDSLRFPLLPNTNVGIYMRLELEDRGSFFEEIFAQNIVESTQKLFLDLSLRKKVMLQLNFEVGCAFYSERNWRHIPVAVETRNIRRISPYLRIIYPMGDHFSLFSHISHNYRIDRGIEKTEYTHGKMDLYYHF